MHYLWVFFWFMSWFYKIEKKNNNLESKINGAKVLWQATLINMINNTFFLIFRCKDIIFCPISHFYRQSSPTQLWQEYESIYHLQKKMSHLRNQTHIFNGHFISKPVYTRIWPNACNAIEVCIHKPHTHNYRIVFMHWLDYISFFLILHLHHSGCSRKITNAFVIFKWCWRLEVAVR